MSRERKSFEITERLKEIHDRDNWVCQVPRCNNRSNQVAHRIANTKSNHISVAKYVNDNCGITLHSDYIIHHPRNLVACCSGNGHNDYFNVGYSAEKSRRVIKEIIIDMVENNKIEYTEKIKEFLGE